MATAKGRSVCRTRTVPQRRQPLLSVEEPELTHLRLPNQAVANETRTTQSEWLFFEVPFT